VCISDTHKIPPTDTRGFAKQASNQQSSTVQIWNPLCGQGTLVFILYTRQQAYQISHRSHTNTLKIGRQHKSCNQVHKALWAGLTGQTSLTPGVSATNKYSTPTYTTLQCGASILTTGMLQQNLNKNTLHTNFCSLQTTFEA
jgi:hypothetical protein